MSSVERRMVFYYSMSLRNVSFVSTTTISYERLEIYGIFGLKYLYDINVLEFSFRVNLLFDFVANHGVIDICVGNLDIL